HTATYTLSLHDALPICRGIPGRQAEGVQFAGGPGDEGGQGQGESAAGQYGAEAEAGLVGALLAAIPELPGRPTLTGPPGKFRDRDRKSTRLNSSHVKIS